MICPQGPKNERNCNILSSERYSHTLILKDIFTKFTRRLQEVVNLLWRILSSIDTFSAQQIQQSLIMSIFTYCGYNSLGWSQSRKSMIRSIEKRSLAIISPKCSKKNCDLRFVIIDNVLQQKACCFVFDWNYFQRFHHNSLNTRNNGKAAELPKVKLDFARRSFYFFRCLCSLPSIKFKKH